MEDRKVYIVINYNCDNDNTEIELTDTEYQAVMRYYDILDDMGISNECSPPIEKKEWERRQNYYKNT